MAVHESVSAVTDEPAVDPMSHFTVGIPLQLRLEGIPIRLTTTSVGCLPSKCVIVKQPMTAAFSSAELSTGREAIVRYRTGEDIFGFRSQLIGATYEPIKLLFLDYPRFVARCDLRNAKRIPSYLAARLVVTRFGFTGFVPASAREGVICDISRSGCCFRMVSEIDHTFSVGVNDKVFVRVQLPGSAREVEVPGETRRIERDCEMTTIGIKFYERGTGVSQEVLRYVSALESSDLLR